MVNGVDGETEKHCLERSNNISHLYFSVCKSPYRRVCIEKVSFCLGRSAKETKFDAFTTFDQTPK